jgi:hypothetical protein
MGRFRDCGKLILDGWICSWIFACVAFEDFFDGVFCYKNSQSIAPSHNPTPTNPLMQSKSTNIFHLHQQKN